MSDDSKDVRNHEEEALRRYFHGPVPYRTMVLDAVSALYDLIVLLDYDEDDDDTLNEVAAGEIGTTPEIVGALVRAMEPFHDIQIVDDNNANRAERLIGDVEGNSPTAS